VDLARRELGLGIGEDLSPVDALRVCWREWRGQTLLIYDNVEDYRDLRGFLPPETAGQFRVLITSRRQPAGDIKKLEIKVLSPGSALAVLRSLVGEARIEGQLADAEALAKWLGYLPLGLDLVGHYLAEYEDERIANLLKDLKAQRFDAEALQDIDGDLKTIQGLFSAFQVSWQVLTPEAQQLGCRLSLFAPAEIPWSFVEAIFPESEHKSLQRLLTQQLLKFSLLERVAERSYEFHPLIREFLGVKLQQLDPTLQDRYKTDFCRAGIQIAEQIPQTVTLAVIAAVETAIPHLETLAQQFIAHIPDENLITPFTSIARYYAGLSAWATAEAWYKQGQNAAESQLDADHPDVATSLNDLAALYESQGRYSEAEPLYLRSLSIRESQLGADHLHVATSLNNLAELYKLQGRYSEAEPLYLRSLSIKESQLGADHASIATSLNNLAGLYGWQGRYSEAEPLYLRSLSIWESQLGADHPDVATSLNNLAALYRLQGRYSEAEPLCLRSLSIRESQLGTDHPDVASSLNNLAELYREQGRYSEAEPLRLRCLEIERTTLGEEHPQFAASLNNLAGLYKLQGRYSEAEPLYLRALQICEQRLGVDHPSTVTVRQNYDLFLAEWRS
jgi:tetratricopeptide (TPR) repeat protein